MKVAMLNLTMGGLSGGYKKYLQRLVPLLDTHTDVAEILQVVPPQYRKLPGLGANVHAWADGEQWRGFPQLQRRVREWKPDVVFVPTARHLELGAPCVSMVRNMEPMLPSTFRDGVTAWAKNRLGAHLARRSAVNSTRVIAVSEFVRDYLVNEWNIDASKVGVVYHGVDTPAANLNPSGMLDALAGAEFVFAAGSLVPYRGLEDAIRSLAVLKRPELKLAIAGDGWPSYRERMETLAAALGIPQQIVWLGHLDQADMSWAYAHCVAFLMTSRVEACPNTALEAMACGAICISSREAPMPEFFREAALYYDAGNAEQLAAQTQSVLAMNTAARHALKRAAEMRSTGYSWQQTADRTVEQLQLAIGT